MIDPDFNCFFLFPCINIHLSVHSLFVVGTLTLYLLGDGNSIDTTRKNYGEEYSSTWGKWRCNGHCRFLHHALAKSNNLAEFFHSCAGVGNDNRIRVVGHLQCHAQQTQQHIKYGTSRRRSLGHPILSEDSTFSTILR